MFSSVSMSFEVFSRDSVRIIDLTWRGKKRCALHLLEESDVHQAVPVLLFGIRLQILRVTRLAHRLKNAILFGNLGVVEVPVISRQIVVHDMADFMKR